MKDGFTLVEVIILFVIFLTVAVLVVPLSVDDAVTAKNNAKWQHVQSGFASIPITMMNSQNYKDKGIITIEDFIAALIKVHPLQNVEKYKIKYLNGDIPEEKYTFSEIYNTDSGASIAFKWFDNSDSKGEDKIYGILMYDVNGKRGPNVWGKDVFGMNIYTNKIEPFGKNYDPIMLETDSSRQGTGLACSYTALQTSKK
ncbi:type II secretion system protein [bacterium]|nr:type II secretion system protein [bacterium]